MTVLIFWDVHRTQMNATSSEVMKVAVLNRIGETCVTVCYAPVSRMADFTMIKFNSFYKVEFNGCILPGCTLTGFVSLKGIIIASMAECDVLERNVLHLAVIISLDDEQLTQRWYDGFRFLNVFTLTRLIVQYSLSLVIEIFTRRIQKTHVIFKIELTVTVPINVIPWLLQISRNTDGRINWIERQHLTTGYVPSVQEIDTKPGRYLFCLHHRLNTPF